MKLRPLLLAGTALLTVFGLTLGPAVQAVPVASGPIATVAVGGSTAAADYDIDLTLQSGASMVMSIFGTPTVLTCSAGSLSGTAHGGELGATMFANMNSLQLTCDSFIPGQPSTYSVNANGCTNLKMRDTVSIGTTDTASGTFNLPTGCDLTASSSPCVVTLGGSTGAQFDEATSPGSPTTQTLDLSGSGLRVRSRTPLCFNALSPGDPVTLQNFVFTTSTDGGAAAVDFQHDPAAGFGNIASVAVGGSTATAGYSTAMTMNSYSSTSAMEVFGSPTRGECYTRTPVDATVHAGSSVPSPFMTVNSLDIVCDGILNGDFWSLSTPGCATVTVPSSQTVHDGAVDSVDGSLNFPTGCNIVVNSSFAPACTYALGGSTPVKFDEHLEATSPIKQAGLWVRGNGLVVRSASFGCLGALTPGESVSPDFYLAMSTSAGASAIDLRP